MAIREAFAYDWYASGGKIKMSEIIHQKVYIAKKSAIRDKEDFSYTLFNSIDFTKDVTPISFFRSDFRGAKFINVTFFLNNLDRADFISSVFIDCKFINTNIAASEMKNCYFENVEFINNKYDNTSIQECTFYKCEFRNENFLINMKNCNIIESKLNNCKFERSTTEKINYEKCIISLVDYANMHAERYSFKSCTMTDIDIDICYIFGYFFYDTSISGINIIYMGEKVEFTKDNMLSKFAYELWSQRRYCEFINANIIFNNLDKVAHLVKSAFNELPKNTEYSGRLETLNIFEALQFYTMCNKFNSSIVKDILNFFDKFDWDNFNLDNKILYLSQVQKLKLYLSETMYDLNFIKSANNDISFVTFCCNTDDYDYALSLIRNCLNDVCLAYKLTNKYEILDSHRGSWIITIAVAGSCALVLPLLFKKYADVIIEIDTKRKINRKIADSLENSSLTLSDLKLITDIAKSIGIVTVVKESHEHIDISAIAKILEVLKIGI